MSLVELAAVRKQLDEYAIKGWIRPSTSPCGASILFAGTKDRTLRMCMDYRALNQYTILIIFWNSWLILTVLVALTSTLVTMRLQSAQEIGKNSFLVQVWFV